MTPGPPERPLRGRVSASTPRRHTVEPQTNVRALETILGAIPSPDPALVALARTLAAELDAGAGMATAAVSKEYRATLTQLRAVDDGGDDLLNSWLADLSAPLVKPEN